MGTRSTTSGVPLKMRAKVKRSANNRRVWPRWTAARWALCVAVWAPGALTGQDPGALEGTVEEARRAWLRHDFELVVASSDTVRLQLPGVVSSASMRPGHAAAVLEEYLESANEIAFELRNIRVVSEDHRYAQMVRRYVVKGTSDERIETVYLGFRRLNGIWRLREVRVTP